MSLATEFREKRDEIRAKRVALKNLYTELDTASDAAVKSAKLDDIGQANRELADLVDKFEPVQNAYMAAEQNDAAIKAMGDQRQIIPGNDEDGEHVNQLSFADEVLASGAKSVSEIMRRSLQSTGRKNFRGFRGDLATEDSPLAVKALLQTSGLTPLEERRPGIQPSAQEERTVADLMLSGTTTAQKITYYEETTFTNATDVVAEGAEKPEVALGFTLREDNVRKIAGWVPVTDEMMEDVPGFESYLRGRLSLMIRQREEAQLLTGSGSGQNILGLYNRTGVQTVTGYGLSTIDSILKAIVEVQKDAFVEPTAMVIHPNDWFEVRTSKDLNGQYLLGPATQDPDTARPWGLQIRVTTNAVENTALVGAYNQAQVFRRSGIAIAISTENEDYFIYNKLAVRAEERLALAVYRPAAFCKVEAIVQGS